MSVHKATIIVAHNKHRVIGVDGGIPWKIPEDLKLFKETTVGHPVIMGRLTWESIPEKYRPLPDRTNIVITRNSTKFFYPKEVVVYPKEVLLYDDLDAAVCNHKEAFIIGGGQIYKEAINQNLVDRILISHIKGHEDVAEGVKFPELKGWSPNILKEYSQFTLVEYKPVLTFEKISEIAMELSLKLTALGIDGYQYNECMNMLRSRLLDSFEFNCVPHDNTRMGMVDWIALREEMSRAKI
jgi:dihydrofolate reductase